MITDLFTHLSYFLQKENIEFIYNLDESPVFSIILKPPSKICMIDIHPSDAGDRLLIMYYYPFESKPNSYAGIVLENFSIALTQLLSIIFLDLKICHNFLHPTYLIDSEVIVSPHDPQKYKYSYIGSFEINRQH